MASTPALAHGHGGGHHGRHHHHGGGGIDGGDLLAGVLIIGGIAAIASAASQSSRAEPRDEPYPYPGAPGPEDRGYGSESRGDDRGDLRAGSFDMAVDACADELERGEQRIGSVDNVRRMGERYSVEGVLSDGRGYACSVDESGQIRSVAVDGHAMI